MNNNNTISIISPQYGTVGTDLNYYKIAKDLANRGNKIKLLVIGDEWLSINNSDNIEIIHLVNKTIFKKLKKRFIPWKITMIFAILLSFFPLFNYVSKNRQSKYLLGLIPLFPLSIFLILRINNKIVFSIQGLPRSFVFSMNLYFSKFVKNINLVIPNESMKDYLGDRYHMPNNLSIEVISNAVLDDSLIMKSNKIVKDKWFIDPSIKIVTAVGRLTYQKNFDMLIIAFKEILALNPNARLAIIGDGEEYNALNNIVVDLNMQKVVKFMGYKTNPYKYIRNSDLFIMCSRWEGPGHVLIEALGVDCPVITTNCDSGPSDTIQNGKFGILIETEDDQQLSEAINYALNNKDEMIKKLNHSKAYLTRFYTKNVTDKYLNLFNS